MPTSDIEHGPRDVRDPRTVTQQSASATRRQGPGAASWAEAPTASVASTSTGSTECFPRGASPNSPTDVAGHAQRITACGRLPDTTNRTVRPRDGTSNSLPVDIASTRCLAGNVRARRPDDRKCRCSAPCPEPYRQRASEPAAGRVQGGGG